LFEKIDEQHRYTKNLKREMDVLKSSLSELKTHYERVKASEYQRALDELKAAKRQALVEEDPLKAEDIQERIDTVKEAQQKEAQRTAAPPPNNDAAAAFTEWVSDNSWYKMDADMREFADAVGIMETNKGNKDPVEVLKIVSERVKKHFPEKFRNPNKDKPAAVETQSTGATGKKGNSFKPTPEQRAIAERFAATGVMTVEQYYADLKAMGELE
jgi:hypothetical protein